MVKKRRKKKRGYLATPSSAIYQPFQVVPFLRNGFQASHSTHYVFYDPSPYHSILIFHLHLSPWCPTPSVDHAHSCRESHAGFPAPCLECQATSSPPLALHDLVTRVSTSDLDHSFLFAVTSLFFMQQSVKFSLTTFFFFYSAHCFGQWRKNPE